MRLQVVLEPAESGWFVVTCPAVPGAVSQGRSREEALANIREAVEGVLLVRREEGWPLLSDTDWIDLTLSELEVA